MTASSHPLWRACGLLGLRGRPVLAAIMLGVCGALSALGLAALSAWLITRAWQMPPVLYLSVAITAVRALGISRGVLRYLERLATHRLALEGMATARELVYRTLAEGSPGYPVTLRRGELLARTGDDIDEIGNAVIRGVIPVAVGTVTGIAAVIVMALVSGWAAVVLAGSLIVSAGVAPWLAARGSARTISDTACASTRSTEATLAALWHAPELTVARRRQQVLASASAADAEALAAAHRGLRTQALAAAATPLAMGVSVLAACLVGLHLASSAPPSFAGSASGHGLTPMILGVLILLPLSSFESTAPLTEAGIQLERSRQSAARVLALVDGAGAAESTAGDEGPTDRPIHTGPVTLATERLRSGHPGGPELGPSGGTTLRLTPGDRLIVTGRSGVGKSTLLLTLAGLLTPRSGRVDCHDEAGDRVDPRSAVCYFAEEGHLFATTVRENLLVARGDADEAEVLGALSAVGLDDWVARLPDGLDTELAGGAEAVSGGQRRRLLLARAMLHPAPVVLLDEPTEHLDDADAVDLLRRVLGTDRPLFDARKTIVVVTHHAVAQDISLAPGKCDRYDVEAVATVAASAGVTA